MISNFIRQFQARPPVVPETLLVGSRSIRLWVVRNPRARRYLLRLRPDGSARVTIPRGGSRGEAMAFVERNRGWLEQQLARFHAQPRLPTAWQVGSEILFRGELVRITTDEAGGIRLGTELLKLKSGILGLPASRSGSFPSGTVPPLEPHSSSSSPSSSPEFAASVAAPAAAPNLRPAIERQLRSLASAEFLARVAALAARHQFSVQRVMVRNQKSRWGSCSRRGTISLNWRLIQTPSFVLDYLILHELAHLREMNHSSRFWREVERLCPEYRVAEQWLKANRSLLR